MKINDKTRTQNRLQNSLFLLLFIAILALVAWLSTVYNLSFDITANHRNTLSQASQTLLQRMPGTVTIQCFAPDSGNAQQLRKNVKDMVAEYQKYKADVKLDFVDPQTAPDLVRTENITHQGELLVHYMGRKQHAVADEESLTNAMKKLLRTNTGKVLTSVGHGERKFNGRANFDYGSFARELLRYGITPQPFNISENSTIPTDTALLIIASPRVKFVDFEIQRIKDYLARGGQLLYIHDPGDDDNLQGLMKELGVEFEPGMIIDPAIARQGYSANITLVTQFTHHPVTDQLHNVLFGGASGIKLLASEWKATPLFQSRADTWSDVNDIKGNGKIKLDKGIDIPGPLPLAVALSHGLTQGGDQRVVVFGDGDFLSNQFLGNGENLLLGLNSINWLMHEDKLIAIPPKVAKDVRLDMGKTGYYVISVIFVILLPLGMLIAGVWIWNRRRKL